MHRQDQRVEISNECFPNIGLRGRQRRLRMGAVAGVVTLAALAALLSQRAHPLVLAALALPAFYAAVLFFQAKEKT